MQKLFAVTVSLSLCALAMFAGAGAMAQAQDSGKAPAQSQAQGGGSAANPAADARSDDQSDSGAAGQAGSHMKRHRHKHGKGEGLGHGSPLGYFEPKPRQVLALPSLTADQRQKITAIYQACKEQTEPLGDKIKAVRDDISKKANEAAAKEDAAAAKSGTAAPAGGKDGGKAAADAEQQPTGIGKPGRAHLMVAPEARAQLKELRGQIQAARSKAWQDVKAILTDAQLNELNDAIDPTIHLGKRAQAKVDAEAAAAKEKSEAGAGEKTAPSAKP